MNAIDRLAHDLSQFLTDTGYIVRVLPRHARTCPAISPGFWRRRLGFATGCDCGFPQSRIVIEPAPPAPSAPRHLVQLVDHEWFYSTKGFTLVEALVTMGVSMAVVGAVATFMLHSARLSTVLVQRTAESVAAKNRLVKCEADIAQAPFDEEEPPASCADVSVTVESSVTAPFSGMTCLTFALDTPGPGGTVLRSLVHGYNCRLVWTELGTLPTESEEEAQ